MSKRQKKSYWKFWWEQVLKGIIPECVYRMAKIRDLKQTKRKRPRNLTNEEAHSIENLISQGLNTLSEFEKTKDRQRIYCMA